MFRFGLILAHFARTNHMRAKKIVRVYDAFDKNFTRQVHFNILDREWIEWFFYFSLRYFRQQ